jgi:precorrin-2 dehydrogenase/sirohydrochlorin ferrochelatase
MIAAMTYPIFVKLEGRRCVVVGAGQVAERRINALLRQGAQVRVVAPQASPVIRALANSGKLSWMTALYSSEHLDSAFLVIAATDDPEINAAVCRDANKRNILVTSANRPSDGSFMTPATVERGDLMVAVTTGGKSPTLSKIVREKIEEQFGPEWTHWTDLFGRLRSQIQQIASDDGRRSAVRNVLSDSRVSERIAAADAAGAEQEAKRCISSPQA